MKNYAIFILFILSFQLQAQSACKCNCELSDRTLCASLYDLDHPCGVLCNGPTPASPPVGKTACPTSRVYNPDRGTYEWRVFCFD